MKKNIFPYNKIKNAVYVAAYGIGLSLLFGIIAFFMLAYYFSNKIWIGLVAFIGVFLVTCAIIYLICKTCRTRQGYEFNFIFPQ